MDHGNQPYWMESVEENQDTSEDLFSHGSSPSLSRSFQTSTLIKYCPEHGIRNTWIKSPSNYFQYVVIWKRYYESGSFILLTGVQSFEMCFIEPTSISGILCPETDLKIT